MFDLAVHPGRLFVIAAFLPLVPVLFILAVGFFRHRLGFTRPLKIGAYLAFAAMLASAGCAIGGAIQYFGEVAVQSTGEIETRWAERTEWIRIGSERTAQPGMQFELGYRIDRLTALMMAMVTTIASLIVLFSTGYMKDELADPVEHAPGAHGPRRGRYERFFLYLSLFAFSMLNLLIADNLFQLFACWELVGLCSFTLIGFYFEKPAASAAANKAFLMNRIGDAGFLIAIAVALSSFGTANIAELNHRCEHGLPHGLDHGTWLLLGFGLLLGAMGKSAQVPLQTWLPDAMEGPTPVSALIHAATMVAAGVYLVGRCFPMFAPELLLTIAYVGLVTAVLSATVAMVITDIKRVLAFSTCSQLGFMMLSLGLGGWTAGLLHLLTHAFFKALLFLGAGSVLHGLHHEQDLRRMGGLSRKMPVTAFTMLIGVLAISGTPLFAGWFSKDQILGHALGYSLVKPTHAVLFFGPLVTAGLTAFYMFRLWFLCFAGEPRDRNAFEHAHESPKSMTIPLVLLAIPSMAVAWGWPIWNAEASALGQLLKAGEPHSHDPTMDSIHRLAEANHLIAGASALFAAVVGFAVACWRYGTRAPTPEQLAEPHGLLAERWYFDAAYDRLIAKPVLAVGALSASADRSDAKPSKRITLDGAWNALATFAKGAGSRLQGLQTGRIRLYVLLLFAAIVFMLAGRAAMWK